MGTRSVLIFKAQSSYERDIQLYSHWDGYFSGTAAKLAAMVKNLVSVKEKGFSDNKPVNAFIAGNLENCEIEPLGSEHGDIEFKYTIDVKNNRIDVQSFNYCEESNQYKAMTPKGYKLTDFINEYAPAEFFIPVGTFNDTLINAEVANKLVDVLVERIRAFGENNPNTKIYEGYISELFDIAVLIK